MKKILFAFIAILSFAFNVSAQSTQRLNNGTSNREYEACGFWGETADGWNCDGTSGTICYCISTVIMYGMPNKENIREVILANRFKGLDKATIDAVQSGKFSLTKRGSKDFLIKPDNPRAKGLALHF